MTAKLQLGAALLAGALSMTTAAADLESIVEGCDGCHGTNGVSQWTDVPTLSVEGESPTRITIVCSMLVSESENFNCSSVMPLWVVGGFNQCCCESSSASGQGTLQMTMVCGHSVVEPACVLC